MNDQDLVYTVLRMFLPHMEYSVRSTPDIYRQDVCPSHFVKVIVEISINTLLYLYSILLVLADSLEVV